MEVNPGSPRTLFEKVWDAHIVGRRTADLPSTLYVDLHLIHEVTSPQAFQVLRDRGLQVRRRSRTVATMDHSTPTSWTGGKIQFSDPQAEAQVKQLERNCRDFGIRLYELGSDRHGIVHVVGPELGLTQPGMTIVCGDSHTSTHGAFGALAFGIGTTEGISRFTKSILFDEKIHGIFHMALGASIPESGGKNESAIHWDMICDLRDGGEIWVDDELLYKNGQFVIEF